MITNLNGRWTISSNTYKDVVGTVPGTVLSILLENKLIEDPYYRKNEYEAKEISFEDFTFEREFDLDKSQLEKTNFLCFDGLDTAVRIFINDVFVGENKDMNIGRKISLPKGLLKEKNKISIHFQSPYKYVNEYPYKEHYDTYCPGVNEPHCQCMRRAHALFGWDWGPNLGDMGIFRDIYILSTDLGHFEYFKHDVTFNENGSVTLKIKTNYKLLGKGKITAKLTLKENNSELTASDSLHETNEFEFLIENPVLWYPNGFGDQTLYDLAFVFEGEGESQTVNKRIGLRKIVIDDPYDQWGRNMSLYVNGIKIFVKGADFIPEDAILGRVNEKRSRRLLKLVKDFNHNTIRIWGGGYYPDDCFYDICDEFGILVFQDLMFACGAYYSKDQEFMDLIREETRHSLRRIRHHACIFLLSGNNEIEDGVRWHPFSVILDYKAIFLDMLPPIVKEEWPEIYYLPSSPTSGYPYLAKPNDNDYLDAHNWEVWHNTQPFEYFKQIYPRFLSEFGCQSMPPMDTIRKYALPEEMYLESDVMDSHQKNKGCNFKIMHYIKSLYKEPKNIEELSYLSMLSVAEGIKMCVEHNRRHKDRCNATIYWQLNDDWPGQSWSSIDYYFGIKALHYYSRNFYAPHLISVDGDGATAKIAISNDTKDTANYLAKYTVMTFDGEIIEMGETKHTLHPSSAKYIHEIDGLDERDDEVLLVELFDEEGNKLSSNFYQAKKDKDLAYKEPNLSMRKIDDKTIEFETDYYAKNIYIEPHDNECVLSDNYFSLLPGQKKIIRSEKELDFSKLEITYLNKICH